MTTALLCFAVFIFAWFGGFIFGVRAGARYAVKQMGKSIDEIFGPRQLPPAK